MIRLLLLIAVLPLPHTLAAGGLTYAGHGGAVAGKQIVLLAGDDGEYHSEEALPVLAKILAVRHGFTCTVLFSTNPSDGTIDPRGKRNIPALEALRNADLLVWFVRWRDLPDDQMKVIPDYVESERPLIAIRPGTHPFWFKSSKTDERWSSDSQIPGYGEIWTPTEVYEVPLPLPSTCRAPVLGQVFSWIGPDSTAGEGKTNDPMMPVMWTKEYHTSLALPKEEQS